MTDTAAKIQPERILVTRAGGNVSQETIGELLKRSDSNRFGSGVLATLNWLLITNCWVIAFRAY